jgi:hypothetical protein
MMIGIVGSVSVIETELLISLTGELVVETWIFNHAVGLENEASDS